MTKKEINSLQEVVSYLWEHESRSFEEEHGYDVDITQDRDAAWWLKRLENKGHIDHILYDVTVLQAYLDKLEANE
jgi:hypothetical protein